MDTKQDQDIEKLRKEFDPKLLDALLEGHQDAESFFGKGGLLDQLAKALVERALEAEMTHHLGHEPGGSVSNEAKNTRNGKSKKKLKSEHGDIELEVPRDRQASFEPILIPKHQRRLAGLDEKIIAMYARGLSDRDIQAQLQDLYGVEMYVTTARAKGLKERRLIFKYPVRVAINPLVSTIGWTLPALVSGEIIVSQVLGLAILGPVLLAAALGEDMYLVGSIVMILSSLTIIGTLLSDILLAWVDPRIRFDK
jgi:hypothetical protein